MKLISWNVNGIKSRYDDGKLNDIFNLNPDIFCIQELKQKPNNLSNDILHHEGYNSYFYPTTANHDNWGTATYTKIEPITIKEGFERNNKFNREGRIQKIEFNQFELYNVYFPSGANKERKDLKYEFYDIFTRYVKKSKKPQVICGDFNRIASNIDDFNIKKHKYNIGSKKDEREWFNNFLKDGFIDTFRLFNKETGNYTYWHNKNQKKENNGYRFDYFLVHEELKENVVDAGILSDFVTHDHAPITLELEF